MQVLGTLILFPFGIHSTCLIKMFLRLFRIYSVKWHSIFLTYIKSQNKTTQKKMQARICSIKKNCLFLSSKLHANSTHSNLDDKRTEGKRTEGKELRKLETRKKLQLQRSLLRKTKMHLMQITIEIKLKEWIKNRIFFFFFVASC